MTSLKIQFKVRWIWIN